MTIDRRITRLTIPVRVLFGSRRFAESRNLLGGSGKTLVVPQSIRSERILLFDSCTNDCGGRLFVNMHQLLAGATAQPSRSIVN